jgi:hypothetical protein
VALALLAADRLKVRPTGKEALVDRLLKQQGEDGVGIEPHFAIGHRALFLRTAKANVLERLRT